MRRVPGLFLGMTGLAAVLLIGAWVIVRSVLALLQAQKRQPIANPESWLW